MGPVVGIISGANPSKRGAGMSKEPLSQSQLGAVPYHLHMLRISPHPMVLAVSISARACYQNAISAELTW